MSDDTPLTNGIIRMHTKGYQPSYIASVLEVDVEDVKAVVKDIDATTHSFKEGYLGTDVNTAVTNNIKRMLRNWLRGGRVFGPHEIASVLEVHLEDVNAILRQLQLEGDPATKNFISRDGEEFDPKLLHDFLGFLDVNKIRLGLREDMFDYVIPAPVGKTCHPDVTDTYKVLVDEYLRVRCEVKS